MSFKAVLLKDDKLRVITGSLCDKISLRWDELSLEQIAHIFESVAYSGEREH